MGLAERALALRGETRYSTDVWLRDYLLPATGQFGFNGAQYPYGLNTSYTRQKIYEVASTLPGHMAALRNCPPAFAAQMVRALVLSQLRFTFRNPPSSRTPRRTFGTNALSVLEKPWTNATTGELVGRMEWHAGLAGNAYVTNRTRGRLRLLRPDWVAILYGSQQEPDLAAHALDGDLLGYVYAPGGLVSTGGALAPIGGGNMYSLLPEETAHWSPLPDPECAGIGMSWITPAVREIQGDIAASQHKLQFFINGATANLVIKGIPATSADQFSELVEMMESQHRGIGQAYKTLYLTAGADATVVGSNMQQIDFKATTGAGETRISVLSRVPAPVLGISEGLAGSSLNAGNFGQARRLFADTWVYPTAQDLCAALAPLVRVPSDAELWFDTADMPLLREDARDAAEILNLQVTGITLAVREGFTAESAVAATVAQDPGLLKHSGLHSVQLQPPGSGDGTGGATPGDGGPKALTPSGATTPPSSPRSTPTERVQERKFDPNQPRDFHGRWSLVGFVSRLLGSVGEARVWHDPDERDGPVIELAVGSAEYLHDWDRHITTPWEDRQRDDESREVDFHGEDIEDLQKSLTKAADAASAGRRYREEHFGSDHGRLLVESDGTAVTLENRHLDDPWHFEDDAEEQLTEEAWQAHWATHPPSDEEDDWTPSVTDAQIKARAKALLARFAHPSTTLNPDQVRQLARMLTQPGKVEARGFNPRQPRVPGGEHGGEWTLTGLIRDLLNLGGRIDDMEPGEKLLGSDKLQGDAGTVRVALTGRGLRLGVGGENFGGRDDEAGPWRAGPDQTAVLNTERARLYRELAKLEELDSLTPAQQTRYAELEDLDLNEVYPSGYTARLDRLGVERLRSSLSEALARAEQVKAADDARWAEVDRLEAEDKALDVVRSPLVRKYRASTPGLGHVQVSGAPPLTAEEDAELDRLTARWVEIKDRIEALKAESAEKASYEASSTTGSIPGQWADIYYDIYFDDADVHAVIGAVPHGSGLEFEDLDDNRANLDLDEARRLLRLLDKATIGTQSGKEVRAAAKFNPALHPHDPNTGRWRNTLDRVLDGLRRWAASGDKGNPFDWLDRRGEGFSREQLRRLGTQRGLSFPPRTSEKKIRDDLLDNLRDALAGDQGPSPVKKAAKKAAPKAPQQLGLRHADAETMYDTLTGPKFDLLAGPDVGLIGDERLVLSREAVERLRLGEAGQDGTIEDTASGPAIRFFGELLPLHGVRARPAPKAPEGIDLAKLRSLDDPEAIRDALDLHKVPELKGALREQKLALSGRKRDLVDRLVEHLSPGKPEAGKLTGHAARDTQIRSGWKRGDKLVHNTRGEVTYLGPDEMDTDGSAGGGSAQWVEFDDGTAGMVSADRLSGYVPPEPRAAKKAVPAKKATPYELAPGYRGPTARARHNQREEALLAVNNAGGEGLGPAMGVRAEALDNLESAGYVRWDGQRWHLTDKGRVYVDAHGEKTGGPDLEQQARARFAEIDAKRKVADMLTEALGLVHNDADQDVARRRITGLALANGVDDATRDALLADVGDHAKLTETTQRLARDAGLTPVAQPGQVVPFDRKLHESIYGSPQPGEKVGVEEAGYTLKLSNGETVQLSKAKVSTYDPKLHGPEPGRTPAGTPGDPGDPAVLGSGLDAVYTVEELDRIRPALSGLTFNDDQNLDNFSRARQQARTIAARWDVSEADLRELQGVLGAAGGARSGSFEDRRRSLLESQFLGWQGAGGGAVATTAIASLLGTDDGFNSQERDFLRDVRANPAARRAAESLARAVYDNTQEWFRERGVTHVRAFRGTPGAEGDRTRPWTSWSLSPAGTSPEFYLGGDFEGPEAAMYERRDIRVRDIPVEEVFSIPPSGFGTYHEQELVVLRSPPAKTPRTFADFEAGKTFLTEHYGAWREGLTEREQKALSFYQSPAFPIVNGLLRGVPEDQIQADVAVTPALLERARATARDLQAAIDKAPPLTEPVTVHRSFGADQFGPLRAGMEITDDGFVSTSLTKVSGGGGVGQRGKPAVATITLPEGTRAAAGSARELVLPPGSRFHVTSVRERGGTTYVGMELVPPVAKTPRKRAPKAPTGRTPAAPVVARDLFTAEDATIETALRDVFEGQFGPYTTKATVKVIRAGTRTDKRGREHKVEPSVSVEGKVYDADGAEIGYFGRSISPVEMHYADGTVRREVWANHSIVQLGGGDYDENPTRYHGTGFGGEFNRRAIEWYRASGVHGIGQSDHNGYVWASQGFNFGQGGKVPDYLAENIRTLIADLRAGKTVSEGAKDEYRKIPKSFLDAPDLQAQLAAAEALLDRIAQTKPGEPGYPTAYEISQLGRRKGQRGKTAVWLGKLLFVSADELILNPDEGEVISS